MKADVTDRGDALVVGGIDREKVPELVAALVAAGVRIYRVVPQEPSLEDVYFALHGEEPEKAVPV
jgi:ABC-2 type transport system ATP-binding protein